MSVLHEQYPHPSDPSAVTPAELLDGLQQREDWALREAIRRHRSMVVRVAASIVGPIRAGDVTQDAFIRLMESAGEIKEGRALGSWLQTVTRRLALDAQRSAVGRREVPTDAVPDPDIQPGRAEDEVEARVLVEQLLVDLRPHDAALLVDHYILDQSLAAMARQHDSTVGSMKVRLSRSRRRAREIARQKGIGLLGGGMPAWLRDIADRLPSMSEGSLGIIASAALLGLGLTFGFGVGGVTDGAKRSSGEDISATTMRSSQDVDRVGSASGSDARRSGGAGPTTGDRTQRRSADPDGADGPTRRSPALTPSELPRTTVPGTDFSISSERDPAPEYRVQLTPAPGYGMETTDGDPDGVVEAFGQTCRTVGGVAPEAVECAEGQPAP